MELIVNTYQALRILSVVKDKSIHDKLKQARIVGDWQKLDLDRSELMLIMHSLAPSQVDNDLVIKIGQAIDRATTIACQDRVRIVGHRGQMPKNSIGIVTLIIEADIDHRNFLVEFEHTDYTRHYLAYEIEPG